jgi:hypothetical protein
MNQGLRQAIQKQGPVVALAAATVFFAVFVHSFSAVQHWLFWRFAAYWIVILVWAGSCLAFGHTVLGRVFAGTLRKTEQLTLGLAVGVLAFGLAIFVVGLGHGLNAVTFFLLPAAFYAVGWRTLARDLRRLRRRLRLGRMVAVPWWVVPILIAAVLGVSVLYAEILSPDSFSFDVRWYHMPIGQRYALEGKVGRFPEGFWQAAWPHLMSYLFAWTFLAPGVLPFDRVQLGAHLDFVMFLAVMAQVPVLVRRMVPGARVGLTPVLMLAFPGVYLYDGNLHAGADHFAGFWAIPMALTFLRAFRHFRPANTALFATMISAAALTKYSAASVVIPFALAMLGRALWLAVRERDRTTRRAFGALAGTSLALTSAQWLKNWIWYGDPMYPVLRKYFKVHPWVPDATYPLNYFSDLARPGEWTARGLRDALAATVTFSFIPNDWEFFHHNVPTFGSLFTLTLPCLLFPRVARRVLWLYALTMSAVFCWYMVSHYDRYLHTILPLMAAATGATLVLVCQSGRWARVAVLSMCALQAIWGSDVPFFPTHNILGDSPLHRAEKFAISGFEHVSHRLRLYEPLSTIGLDVPKDATLLAHDTVMILGLDHKWVTDLHQCGISYGLTRNPGKIDDLLKRMGVTHLLWIDVTGGRDSLAGDLAFMNYAMNYAIGRKPEPGGRYLAQVPAQRPTDAKDDYDVALFGCGRPYTQGWYRLSQLTKQPRDPSPIPEPIAPLASINEANQRADFIVIDACVAGVNPSEAFVMGPRRDQSQLWLRIPGANGP